MTVPPVHHALAFFLGILYYGPIITFLLSVSACLKKRILCTIWLVLPWRVTYGCELRLSTYGFNGF